MARSFRRVCILVLVWIGWCLSASTATAQFVVKDTTDQLGNPVKLQVNRLTQSPHRVWDFILNIGRYGTPAAALTRENIDAVSRRFLTEYRGLLRVDPASLVLKQVNTQPDAAGAWWFIEYAQHYRGIPVYHSTLGFTINPQGQIVSLGSDTYPNIGISTTPAITSAQAIDTARAEFVQGPSDSVVIRNAVGLLIYPDARDSTAITYHLVYPVELIGYRPLRGRAYFIDAQTGQIVHRAGLIRDGTWNLNGTVRGDYWPEFVNINQTNEVLQDMSPPDQSIPLTITNILGQQVATGAVSSNGTYSITWSASHGTYFLSNPAPVGTWIKITNGPTQSFPFTSSTNTVHDLLFTAENDGHNVYHHGSLIHDFYKSAPFSYTGMDYQMQARINDGSGTNGKADGTNIFFGSQSGIAWAGYSDVVYHEYTHNTIYHLYGLRFIGDPGQPALQGSAMDEGFSDYFAATLNGNSVVDPVNRDLQNTLIFPHDYNFDPPSPHGNGKIIGGAAWDLRQLIGVSGADQLVFRALQMTPHAFIFSEFMDNVLLADDNDGTLGNGTPNQGMIQQAFTTNHGITSNLLGAPPAAPSSLTATALSSSKIKVTWTDHALNELGYYIERKKSTESTYTQIATVNYNVTSFTNTGLEASTTYSYRVRAYNNAGTSGYSNIANATTQAPPPPISSVTITGPDPATSGIKNFYTVNITGGSGNFDIQWYKRESASGSNYFWYDGYTTIVDVFAPPMTFALRVDVTDNASSQFVQAWKGVGGASTPTRPVVNLPSTYALEGNYPNPFNPSTTIRFALPQASHVRLEIYNVAGRRVRLLLDESRPAGRHAVVWDGRSDSGEAVASGLYLYRITAGAFVARKKMTLLK